MSHARKEADQERDDGAIRSLIEAERIWRARLDAARAEAARIVDDARAEAERAVAAVQAELAPAVERRRRELQAAHARAVADVASAAASRAAQYDSVEDDTVNRIAGDIARRVPWLASSLAEAPR